MRYKLRATALAACSIATIVLGFQAPASAAAPSPERSTVTLNGKPIDLANGWGNAHTCVVRSASATVTHTICYTSPVEADVALGHDPNTTVTGQTEEGAASLPSCSTGWLCLYEHQYGGGRRLMFNDEYWHDLGVYGFSGQTSSWRNTQTGQSFCGPTDHGYLRDWQYYSYTLDSCSLANTNGQLERSSD